ANSGTLELLGSGAKDNYYNLLVQGFRNGQLNLEREAPAGFKRLENPYNYNESKPYLLIPGALLHDLSYFNGKFYLYFGVTPALVLFWPYTALTGHSLLHRDATVIFFSIGFLASVALLWSIWC